MRMPNGYGSIINLGAGRRKPYAIRTTYYVKNPDTGKKKQKFKYIGYYEKYGFNFIGMGYHPWGETSRIYKLDL